MKGLIFTYMMTGLGAAGGLISPFLGLLVYISFSILRPDFMWRWSVPEGNYSRVVALGMLAGWALTGFGRWSLGRAWLIINMLLLYWVWMLVSSFQAVEPGRAFELLIFYAKVIAPVLVGITTITSVHRLRILAWVILISLGYLAFELHVYYYLLHYNMAREEGFGGMDNNCLAIEMVTGVGLAFFLGLASDQWWKKAIAFCCALLMVHVILFSFSRGGMLALGLTGLLSFFFIDKKLPHYLLFFLALAFAVRMAGPQVRERFMSSFGDAQSGLEASAQSRLDLWRAAMRDASHNPILGLGGDNWGLIASAHGFPEGKEVHSLWVQNAAEVGFPGVLFLMGYFGFCIIRLWPIARNREPVVDPWLRHGARMVVASLVGFCISAQFVTIKYLEVPFYIAMMGAAILMLNREQKKKEPAPLIRGERARSSRAKPFSFPV